VSILRVIVSIRILRDVGSNSCAARSGNINWGTSRDEARPDSEPNRKLAN
jgi:hypothetical protein